MKRNDSHLVKIEGKGEREKEKNEHLYLLSFFFYKMKLKAINVCSQWMKVGCTRIDLVKQCQLSRRHGVII